MKDSCLEKRFNPDRIMALRLSHHLNLSDFAKKIGASRQLVEQWEKGSYKPGTDSLAAIANKIINLYGMGMGMEKRFSF